MKKKKDIWLDEPNFWWSTNEPENLAVEFIVQINQKSG